MSPFKSRVFATLLALSGVFVADGGHVQADERVFIPGYWDLRRRPEKPDVSRIRQIRFLTESDYPPMHFLGPDGALTGFEVELARALCEVLAVTCTVQPHRWDRLPEALTSNAGDAIIAAFPITPANRKTYLMTSAYHRVPARFVTGKDTALVEASGAALKGVRVAVVAGSAHEAYLKAFFPDADPVPQPDSASVLAAVRYGGVAAGFIDGMSAAFWLNGAASAGCCRFLGGPYSESLYFGEGAGIAVRPDAPHLHRALDWALHRLAADGVYARLYLKYFPVGLY